MADLDALAHKARHVAERSRLRMAARVVWATAALAGIALVCGAQTGVCLCTAMLLLLAATLLRWRNRAGVDAVTTGLALGAIPFAAALVMRACGVEGAPLGSVAGAEIICFAAGAIAGAGVSLHVARTAQPRRHRWLAALLIACLTASLGCVTLGAAALVSTLAAVLASAALAWIPIGARAA